jgi:hypothetical protein
MSESALSRTVPFPVARAASCVVTGWSQVHPVRACVGRRCLLVCYAVKCLNAVAVGWGVAGDGRDRPAHRKRRGLPSHSHPQLQRCRQSASLADHSRDRARHVSDAAPDARPRPARVCQIPLSNLPDAQSVLDVLKPEMAPLSLWLQFAVRAAGALRRAAADRPRRWSTTSAASKRSSTTFSRRAVHPVRPARAHAPSTSHSHADDATREQRPRARTVPRDGRTSSLSWSPSLATTFVRRLALARALAAGARLTACECVRCRAGLPDTRRPGAAEALPAGDRIFQPRLEPRHQLVHDVDGQGSGRAFAPRCVDADALLARARTHAQACCSSGRTRWAARWTC